MAKKFSDSLCSSENHFGLYFQKIRPEIYYFSSQHRSVNVNIAETSILYYHATYNVGRLSLNYKVSTTLEVFSHLSLPRTDFALKNTVAFIFG